ncbi:hypothetical protein PFISCL1PPCAC_10313, partial [Pristionchus fissidentatus]
LQILVSIRGDSYQMSKNGMMKRKSCDALDFSVQTQAKKDRAWYDQEHESEKERTKDKKRLSFIGNIFSKMKSSSKLSASTSSLHKAVSRTASDENSFRSTSEHSTISIESQKYKRNVHLKTFFNNATSSADISMGEGSSEADSIGSAGSLNTPVRGESLNRESELRHSSRSMPAPATPHEGTVRRAHSTVASAADSPSIWLRRKSLRLRQRKLDPEMEELKEEEEPDNAFDASSNPSHSASFHQTESATPKSIFVPSSKIDRSRSAAAYSSRHKVMQKRADESPVCFSTSGTPDVVSTMPKKLTPSTGSTSTLQKFGSSIGAVLKRGFSSGSRAQRTPRNGSQTTDALVTVMRRQTMDKRKGHDASRLGGRRMSDISSYGDVSMHLTPRNMEDSRGGFFDTDMTTLTAEFSTKVTVPLELDSILTDESFDAIAIDVANDGSPLSDYSRTIVAQLDLEKELKNEMKLAHPKGYGVMKRSEGKKPGFVIFVIVSDSDRGRQLRTGYEAALAAAFTTPEIKRLMLPQLFCTTADFANTEAKVGDSIVRSTYMAFVRGDNHSKLDSIVIVGNDVQCAVHLNECLDKLVAEKVNGRVMNGMNGNSMRR